MAPSFLSSHQHPTSSRRNLLLFFSSQTSQTTPERSSLPPKKTPKKSPPLKKKHEEKNVGIVLYALSKCLYNPEHVDETESREAETRADAFSRVAEAISQGSPMDLIIRSWFGL